MENSYQIKKVEEPIVDEMAPVPPEVLERLKQFQEEQETKKQLDELREQDDAVKIAMGIENGFVVVAFNKTTTKIMMTKKNAREFSRRLAKLALS
jgi:hypothetical protein